MILKYGTTGFVEVHKRIVRKYSRLDEFYWLREFLVLKSMWNDQIESIVQVNHFDFSKKQDPNTGETSWFFEINMPRYSKTINDFHDLSDQNVIQILIDLLSAITYLHENDIIHRDIKPLNIAIQIPPGNQIQSIPRAILLDFSHATANASKIPKLDYAIATYTHRAPEVFHYMLDQTTTYNNKIDIWSLGIVLFELLTQLSITTVCPSGTESDIRDLILSDSFLDSLNSVYWHHKKILKHSAIYWTWILKMLQYDAEHRPTAADLLNEVMNYADQHGIQYVKPVNVRKVFEEQQLDYPIETELQKITIEKLHTLNIYGFDKIISLCKDDLTEDNYPYVIACLYAVQQCLNDEIYDLDDFLHELQDYGYLEDHPDQKTNFIYTMIYMVQKYL